MVDAAVVLSRHRPFRPPELRFKKVFVTFPNQLRLYGLVLLEGVEVFQEKQPGALLRVVQLAGAARVFPQDVVDVFEGLFEHGVVSCPFYPQAG